MTPSYAEEALTYYKQKETEETVKKAKLEPCPFCGELMKKDGRVSRFVDLCLEQYKCYEEGYITLEELAKCLKDEAGVEVDCW